MRTSRKRSKRTSRARRLDRNGIDFVDEISPLAYDRWSDVKRIALIDRDAPPAKPGHMYFAPKYKTDRAHRAPKGHPRQGEWIRTPLKKPKLETPGASEHTVAFVDYVVMGPDHWYLAYMRTRADQQGKGLARRLIDEIVSRAKSSGVKTVNFGKVMSPAVWKMLQELVQAHKQGLVDIKFTGHKDF